MDFEIHLRSLRGHKGVKGQIYKDAPIELKFQYNDPNDILSILKIFCNSTALAQIMHKQYRLRKLEGKCRPAPKFQVTCSKCKNEGHNKRTCDKQQQLWKTALFVKSIAIYCNAQ